MASLCHLGPSQANTCNALASVSKYLTGRRRELIMPKAPCAPPIFLGTKSVVSTTWLLSLVLNDGKSSVAQEAAIR